MQKTKWLKLIAAVFVTFLVTSPAKSVPLPASSALLLEVTYTNGGIVSGPLSFGLVSLPTEVTASFVLPAPTPPPVGPAPIPIPYPNTSLDKDDVSSASISFGDATWTILNSFELEVEDGQLESLSYDFLSTFSATASSPVILNFPLMITGTDIASGDEFIYQYETSTFTVTTVPLPGTLGFFAFGMLALAAAGRRKNFWRD